RHMRERVDLKSPVREYRPPGSVRGAPGNRRPYLDRKQREQTISFSVLSVISFLNPGVLRGQKKIPEVRNGLECFGMLRNGPSGWPAGMADFLLAEEEKAA